MFNTASVPEHGLRVAFQAEPAPAPRLALRSPAARSIPIASVWHWLAAALDELDYGIVLLQDDMRIVHINDAARVELDELHPLQLIGDELRARLGRDINPLHEAVQSAAARGLRRLLTLGEDSRGVSISVVPLEGAEVDRRAVLVVLGKRAVCESLSIHGFARAHSLTTAETRVLVSLCNGVPPALAAQQLGVAVSTVRSQIQSIRAKTGSESIRALIQQIAVLPPVKGTLRSNGGTRSGWSVHDSLPIHG